MRTAFTDFNKHDDFTEHYDFDKNNNYKSDL